VCRGIMMHAIAKSRRLPLIMACTHELDDYKHL